MFLWVTFLLVEFLINLHSVLRMGSVPFLRFFLLFRHEFPSLMTSFYIRPACFVFAYSRAGFLSLISGNFPADASTKAVFAQKKTDLTDESRFYGFSATSFGGSFPFLSHEQDPGFDQDPRPQKTLNETNARRPFDPKSLELGSVWRQANEISMVKIGSA